MVPSVLAVIAARGGSKSVPRKNLVEVGGRPLIAWSIAAALASRVSRTIVTTEDPEIAEAARKYGAEVPFTRPAALAQDETPGTDAILHAVEWLERHEDYRPDLVVSLQPTSPFRTAADIDAAIALLESRKADSVVAVTSAEHNHPHWMKRLTADGWVEDFLPGTGATARRQELPAVYGLTGALYLARRDVLLARRGWYSDRTAAYVMPPERSLDVDSPWDMRLACLIASDPLRDA